MTTAEGNRPQRARRLVEESIVWDMTVPYDFVGVSPLVRAATLPRIRQAGFSCATLTVGGDGTSPADALRPLARERRLLEHRADTSVLVSDARSIRQAKAQGRIAVMFQFQGIEPVARDTDLVAVYVALGVRIMLLAYNQKNPAGDGCMELFDGGLSRFGRRLVRAMNDARMLVDVSHTGYRTAFEVIEASTAPVVMSHSNPLSLCDNPRNVPDSLIRACADTGGVIGIAGVGRFLNPRNDTASSEIARHVDYVASLVGPAHVGLGLDWVADTAAAVQLYATEPDCWPDENLEDPDRYAEPEQLHGIVEALLGLGWSAGDIQGMLGGNWLRLCESVWNTEPYEVSTLSSDSLLA